MILAAIRSALAKDRADGNGAKPAWSPPSLLAWFAIAVAVAVWVMVVWDTVAPIFGNDDISNLVYGSKLVEPGYHWALTGWSYLPGMSVLYAPLWAISNDPTFIARAASVIVGILGVLTLWPLTRLAQALGLTRNAGMIVAAIVMIAPGRALNGNYYWGETLLGLGVAVLALTGLRLAREASIKNAVIFALASALTMSAHGRVFVVVGVAGLALLALSRSSMRAAIAGVATYVVTVGGVLLLYRYESAVNFRDARTERSLSSLTDGTFGDGAVAATSQLWYHVIAWWALAILGVALLVRMVRSRTDRLWAWWAIAGFGVMYVFVVILVARPREGGGRLDGFAYGRYSEGVTFLLGFLGLVFIVKGVSRLIVAITAATAVVIGILYLVIVVPQIPNGGLAVPAHMPGLFLWLDDQVVTTGGKDHWPLIVAVSILFGVVGALIARFRALALSVMALYFLGYTTYADGIYLHASVVFGDGGRGIPIQVYGMGELPQGVPLAVDSNLELLATQSNYYSYWLYPTEFEWFDPATDTRPSDMVLARTDWQPALDGGALPLNGSLGSFENPATPGVVEQTWVWVFPGEVQDTLDAQGRLAHRVGD